MLGNLHPAFRSRLEAVNLVCLFKSDLLENYSINNILRPFIEDLKKLQKVFLHTVLCINIDLAIFFHSQDGL